MATSRQLELFIAVAEAGSMRKAADRLGIAQPSISKQIRSLERSVGGELIHRTRGERATLSRLGIELLEDARNAMEAQRRLVQRHGAALPRPRIYLRGYLLDIIKRRFAEFEAAGLPSDTSFIASDDPAAAMAEAAPAPNAFALFGSIRLPANKDFVCHVVHEQACSVYAAPRLAQRFADGSLAIGEVLRLYPSRDFRLTPWLMTMTEQAGLEAGRQVFGPPFIDLIAERVANEEGISVFLDIHVRPLVEEGRLVAIRRCPDPLLLVLLAGRAVDTSLFARVCRALHVL